MLASCPPTHDAVRAVAAPGGLRTGPETTYEPCNPAANDGNQAPLCPTEHQASSDTSFATRCARNGRRQGLLRRTDSPSRPAPRREGARIRTVADRGAAASRLPYRSRHAVPPAACARATRPAAVEDDRAGAVRSADVLGNRAGTAHTAPRKGQGARAVWRDLRGTLTRKTIRRSALIRLPSNAKADDDSNRVSLLDAGGSLLSCGCVLGVLADGRPRL
jgi:hypothetical protein